MEDLAIKVRPVGEPGAENHEVGVLALQMQSMRLTARNVIEEVDEVVVVGHSRFLMLFAWL